MQFTIWIKASVNISTDLLIHVLIAAVAELRDDLKISESKLLRTSSSLHLSHTILDTVSYFCFLSAFVSVANLISRGM